MKMLTTRAEYRPHQTIAHLPINQSVMFRFFELFITKMKASFYRIARATKHEVTPEDLQQEAWLVAHDIGQRRGREIDFSDPADQELVIKAVNLSNVKRGDWHLRKSVRIDRTVDNDEHAVNWSEILPARASSDPLISLLLKENAIDADAMLAASYSQATAYVMVLVKFKYNRNEVCAYLVISNDMLARRVTQAADSVRVQPSLFDRFEQITHDFMPPRGRQYAVRAVQAGAGTQWGWDF